MPMTDALRARVVAFALAALLGPAPTTSTAAAQTFSSGSTGADGAFAPTTTTTLALPPGGVLHFTTITVPAGVTVRFTRNATNTPVTLLATGPVTIAGTLDLGGGNGLPGGQGTRTASNGGSAGPGGFDGGSGATAVAATTGGSGLGPGGGAGGVNAGPPAGGGGHVAAGGGANGGPAYGTPALVPAVGGSGGGGGAVPAFGLTGGGGGGGGGVLVIAASGTITHTGTITVAGGAGGGGGFGAQAGGGGSGGAVRLVASGIAGTGTINVSGGAGSNAGSAGRVRLESFTSSAQFQIAGGVPATVSSAPPTSLTLAAEPSLRIATIAGVATPPAPGAAFGVPDVTLPETTTNPVTVDLAAANVPPGTTVVVTVKGQFGGATSATSTPLTGSLAASTASATVTIPTDQPCVVTASASFALLAAGDGASVLAGGEPVERVRVTANSRGHAEVVYITAGGRELAAR
jgi:hypothetical protein